MNVCLLLSLLFLTGAQLEFEDRQELQRTFDRWNEPVEPFRLIGNIHFVGMRNISSFLLTGDEGHVLIDTGFSNSVPLIQSNIVRLGFSLPDIKYILSSHAHCDHVAGHAGMKRVTGAQIIASAPDAALLESGGKKDFLFAANPMMRFEPVSADRVIKDGEEIRLGTIRLTAHLTPGHTPGCTTWTTKIMENGKTLDVVFFGSTSINPGTRLLNNTEYPRIADDIRATYKKLRALPCDVFLAPHSEQFGMQQKRERFKPDGANPFIDRGELLNYLETAEAGFKREFDAQRSAR